MRRGILKGEMTSRKRLARFAGLLYLLMSVCAVVSLNNVPSFTVAGGKVFTARQLEATETAYRIGVASDLVGQVLFVWLVVVLYRLLREVNQGWAMLMVAFVLVANAMSFANTLLGMAPLILLGGDGFGAFDQLELEALAGIFLNLRGYGTRAAMLMWGLWLLPLGLLVARSGFLPRFIGWTLVVGCFGYVAVSLTSLLFPAYADRVMPLLLLGVGEVLFMLWLLILGAREDNVYAQSMD